MHPVIELSDGDQMAGVNRMTITMQSKPGCRGRDHIIST
jgi:hypothetical protein